jgi:hypothetical protein
LQIQIEQGLLGVSTAIGDDGKAANSPGGLMNEDARREILAALSDLRDDAHNGGLDGFCYVALRPDGEYRIGCVGEPRDSAYSATLAIGALHCLEHALILHCTSKELEDNGPPAER